MKPRDLWKNYGLSITLAVLFLLSWFGQAITQWQHSIQEARMHGESLSLGDFSWEFLASTFENWQSEFLQLLTFVVLTSFLIHRGSHESKDSDEDMKRQLNRIEEKLKKRSE